MNNRFFGYYECTFEEEAHIRDKTFKVTIPSLFLNKESFNGTKETTTTNRNNSLGTGGAPGGQSFTSTTIIEAANHTDYYYQLRGNILKAKMDSTDGVTEPKEVSGKGTPDFESHTHDIKAPMSLFKFTYQDLNNIKIPKGYKGYGFFINGSMDANSFAVVRIEGVVPLSEEDAEKVFYQE